MNAMPTKPVAHLMTPEQQLEFRRSWHGARRQRERVLDAETVIYRLEEAGRTLLALPGKGCLPAGMAAAWPDVVHAAVEAYGYDPEDIRPSVPSADAISRMDEAWQWMALIPLSRNGPGADDRYSRHGGAFLRRLVMMRALVNPVTGRHRWSWRRLGQAFNTNHEALRTWHAKAIDGIVGALKQN